MNLRVKQTEATRDLIIDAASDLVFSDVDPHSITMQAIADAAGVSHRTLYRHFENREALIRAIGQRMDAENESWSDLAEPMTFDEWIDGVEMGMRFGATFREQLRRAWTLGVSTGMWRRDRDENYFRMFRERFPNLDEHTARLDFAALRHLYGSADVILIGERFELSPEEVAESVSRAVQALVADIDRRDREAAS